MSDEAVATEATTGCAITASRHCRSLVCARCKTATYCSKDCQIKAWRAGHKGECVPAARADTRTAARPTADQHVLKILEQAYGNLGNAYRSQGDFAKAIEYNAQYLAITKEVGDRAGEGKAYGNLGNAYRLQGDFAKAIINCKNHASATRIGCRVIEYLAQHLAIAKEVGDRAGEGRAYRNLGTCHMHLNEYVKAVAYFEAQHALAVSLKLAHVQCGAALNMGVARDQPITLSFSPLPSGVVMRLIAWVNFERSPSSFTSGQVVRTLLPSLTKLLERRVTRLHRRGWMIECARRQSGSRLPSI